MKRKVNWPKFLIILFLTIYASGVLVKQEIAIKKYEKEKISYMEQINLANKRHEEYKNYSEYVNSVTKSFG